MLYIVIPVHNRREMTKECLLSLQNQTVKNFKIIIVDDGSTDGTSEMIKSEFPEVILLNGDGNLFWTAATNLGVRYAMNHQATYIMTLNDDTIPFEDFIEKMHYWTSKRKNALLGALSLDISSKKPIYGGAINDWKWNKIKYLLDEIEENDQHGIHRVTHFPGRGLFIPVQVFEKIGLFAEKVLPHCTADYDFTQRATRKGFEIYCNYDAKLYMYPEENADFHNRKKKSLNGYYYHLFGMKGGGNLKTFTTYALRNCPPKYLPYFLLSGYFRRIFGYFVK